MLCLRLRAIPALSVHPQSDAAASRRRELKTATGRADIARTVLRLKANKAVATAAAAAAAVEQEESLRTEALAATTAAGTKGPVEASATPSESASAAAAAGAAPSAPDARAAEKGTKALVEKGVQLFGLFDGALRRSSYLASNIF